ncbi:MAG: hypothetical protein QN716_02180 [Nitrososphaeraceae archaeon]|jgi:hypothetical protein|nr:hypothetical protein [Nitrososphaeraceae archaeon]
MLVMNKDFIVSKIEASQDGSPYVYVTFTDPHEPKSPLGGGSGEAVPIMSPEDLMKNLPKAMSNMFGGKRGVSPTFRISTKDYEDAQLKVGEKVTIGIKKADSSGV